MDFSTGNSGNLLREAVIKTGKECLQEGSYCQYLGSDICPEIYALIPDGFVMESLRPAPRTPELLRRIESLLQTKVWNRPALPSSTEVDWHDHLSAFGIDIPDWIEPIEPCLCHGDPTASNALVRGEQLIMCDPRPPRAFIPQCRETDMGRILQSMLGWETVAYGATLVDWLAPSFFRDPVLFSKARFWCGAAIVRIEVLERTRIARPHILAWCNSIRRLCHV